MSQETTNAIGEATLHNYPANTPRPKHHKDLTNFHLLKLFAIPLALIYLSFRLAWAAFRFIVFIILDLLCFSLEMFVDATRCLPEMSVAIAKAIPPIWNVWVAIPVSRWLHSFAKWYAGRLLPRLKTWARKCASLAQDVKFHLAWFKHSFCEALKPVAKSLAAIGKLFVVDAFV